MTSAAKAIDVVPSLDDSGRFDPDEIVGVSPSIRGALAVAWQFARTELSVLILGPTGSGKELFARAIHRWSGRSGPLVDVNCGALPSELVEGELFGHRRGAFTGAVDDRIGLVSAANRGTLFLDELSSLPLLSQVKLLRVLETGEVRRVGETTKRHSDFRVVAAAHPELLGRVENARFRRDLFHRLAGIVIELPPLASRPSDILPLARHFASRRLRTLAAEAEAVLLSHSWPGNVRELRAVLERAALLSSQARLDVRAIQQAVSLGGAKAAPASNHSLRTERYSLLADWISKGWRVEQIAAEAGVHRATVFRWLRSFGLSLRR